MVNENVQTLNHHVIQALSRTIQRFPVGAIVRIMKTTKNSYIGYCGVVVKNNPEDQAKALILVTHDPGKKRIKPRLVDLRAEQKVYLELAL